MDDANQLWLKIKNTLSRYIYSLSDCSATPESLNYEEAIANLNEAARLIDVLALFSTNEELDDISTPSLIYLIVPFLLGQCYMDYPIASERLRNLKLAVDCYTQYLELVQKYQILLSADYAMFSDLADCQKLCAEKKRTLKCELLKRTRQIEEKLNSLEKPFAWALSRLDKKQISSEKNEENEEVERLIYICILQRAAYDSFQNINMTHMEIELLRNMPDKSVLKSVAVTSKLPKPFIYKITNPITAKDIFRDRLFKPRHTLPTISLEEAARIEMEQAVNSMSSKQWKKSPENSDDQESSSDEDENQERSMKGNLYNNKVKDPLDVCKDYTENFEKKTLEQRRWDDWKDENAKGSGNKMANIG